MTDLQMALYAIGIALTVPFLLGVALRVGHWLADHLPGASDEPK